MIILGVDMSGNNNTVALAKDNEILGEISITVKMKHLQEILPSIDYLLNSAGKKISNIDLFVIITGPGSWTGIRIAVTMFKTMAQSLNKPVVGVCSLDALAFNYRFTDVPVYSIVDASKEQVYYAGYNCSSHMPVIFTDYSLIGLDKLLKNIQGKAILIGDGINKYRSKIGIETFENIFITQDNLNKINGLNIIESGLSVYKEKGIADTFSLTPFYMQESDAERKLFKS